MISRNFLRFWLSALLAFSGMSLSVRAAIPAAPSNCTAVALSATATYASIRVEWDDNSTDETQWKLQYTVNGSAVFEIPITSSTSGTTGRANIVLNGQLNSGYVFRMLAVNASGASSPSNATNVGTYDLVAPINFSVTTLDPFNVTLKWEEGSTSEAGFAIERKVGSGAWEYLFSVAANSLSLGPINLTEPLQTYSFRIRAFKGSPPTTPDSPADANVSAYSTSATFTSGAYTLTATPVPGQPVVNLSWPNILNESGYQILYRQAGGLLYSVLGEVAANVSGVQVTTPDIGPALSYVFVVRPFVGNTIIGSSSMASATVDGITSKTGSSGTPGSPFSHAFTHVSASAVSSRTLTGVPAGLTFDSDGGVLSGVCPASGNYTLNYSLNLANGGQLTQAFSLRVRPPAGPPVVGTGIPEWNGMAGSSRDTPLAETFTDPEAESAVRVDTTLGTMDFILFDTAAPATVVNFMSYVNTGKYNDVVFHRSLAGFVIQGGGFKGTGTGSDFTSVAANSPVTNEPGIANERGTISMAKLAGNPNSATDQFFVNLGDNRANLDYQNGGFTVFGRVAGDGMAVADAISHLPSATYQLFLDGGASPASFEDFPMNDFIPPVSMDQTKLVKINSVSPIPTIHYSITGNTQPAVATASIVNGQLHLVGLAGGQTAITVTATDLDNLSSSQTFVVNLSDTYATWASRDSFPGGQNSASQNPDGDALGNLQEYAFFGNPSISSQGPLPVPGRSGVSPAPQFLTLTFPVRKFTSGLTYMVEANDGMSGMWTTVWSSANGFEHAQVVGAVDQPDRTVVTIKDTAAIGGQLKRFLRTRIVQE